MILLYISLILILLGGICATLLPENHKVKVVCLFSGLGTLCVIIPVLNILLTGNITSSNISFPYPIGKVNLVIDSLSAFFILVISFMGFIGNLYSIGYIKPYLKKNNCISSHYFFLSLLTASMIMVVVVQNALFFLIMWEIMSLSSFFLVIFENEKKEVLSAGINYLVTMHISILFIIIGFIMLSSGSGSLNFSSFKPTDLAFVILFVGFGIKAGFVPFHSWLPKAHPAAPSHVSAIMSGVMIKMGIYGILRILSLMDGYSAFISYFVLTIAVISALFGVLYATAQSDLKKLLAYSSVENIGIIGIGIGAGMLGVVYNNNLLAFLGFSAGILHILNHSIFKILLFLATGAVYNKTHIKNMELLGGIIKTMPYTATTFLIGSIAIIGLPPLNGFVSEFLIYLSMLHGMDTQNPILLIILVLVIAALALVGTMALLCFTKAFSIVFLGFPRSIEAESAKEDVPKIMLLPMGILSLFIFLIGLFPQYILMFVKKPVTVLLNNYQFSYEYVIPLNILKTVSLGSFCFIAIFLTIYALRNLLLKNKNVYNYKTWDCGYQYGNNRIQYTASSYASPFLSFLKPFLVKKFDIYKPVELFPKEARFELHIHDIFEYYLITPVLKANKNFLQKFYWIQSGNTQQYILYGLIFLFIALAGTIGVN